MPEEEFDEWLQTMINGILSLAQHRLADSETGTGGIGPPRSTRETRRTGNFVPLEEKWEELAKWQESWKDPKIEALVKGLRAGRPLRQKNFQLLVDKMHSGKWWPLVSLTHPSASTRSDGWLTVAWLVKPNAWSILRVDLEGRSQHQQQQQQLERERTKFPPAFTQSPSPEYKPLARGHDAPSPSVFGDGSADR